MDGGGIDVAIHGVEPRGTFKGHSQCDIALDVARCQVSNEVVPAISGLSADSTQPQFRLHGFSLGETGHGLCRLALDDIRSNGVQQGL